MTKKEELAENDSIIFHQGLNILINLRQQSIIQLESRADNTIALIKQIYSDDPPKKHKTLLVELIIYLADNLINIVILDDDDGKSNTILETLNLKNSLKRITPVSSFINICIKKNIESPYFFPICETFIRYKGFTYNFLIEKIHFELTKGKNINFYDGLDLEIKAYNRKRKKPIKEDHKNYDFYRKLDEFNEIFTTTDIYYEYCLYNKKNSSLLLKSTTKPHIFFYRHLYYEIKSINTSFIEDFNKRDFLIQSFDLFKLLSFENYDGSTFDYITKLMLLDPINNHSRSNKSKIKRFKFQKMRDMMQD